MGDLRRRMSGAVLRMKVLGLFIAVEVGLRVTRLPQLCAWLGIRLGQNQTGQARRSARPVSRHYARRAFLTVNRNSARWPFGDTCLRRSLVLGALLRSAEPVLVIGVKQAGPSGIDAHSWLEIGGRAMDSLASEYSAMPAP